jgi:hypothetical protein
MKIITVADTAKFIPSLKWQRLRLMTPGPIVSIARGAVLGSLDQPHVHRAHITVGVCFDREKI